MSLKNSVLFKYFVYVIQLVIQGSFPRIADASRRIDHTNETVSFQGRSFTDD